MTRPPLTTTPAGGGRPPERSAMPRRDIPAVDHREPARRALAGALDKIGDADPLDRPLILAQAGTGYAVLCAASAVMTTGTRLARALEEISGHLARVNEAIR
jgi:hypothetical protein